MFNLPWQKHGRWYKFFIESDGSEYKLTRKDKLAATINSSSLVFPDGFHVVDTKYDINSVTGGSASTLAHTTKRYADGKQGIILPNVAYFDYANIYVFGYFK